MSEIQFDSLIGGNVNLPSTISLLKFSSSRSEEIKSMKEALSIERGTKLAFQRLPKHMRRRTMSHNVKRLPRRLREIHLNQMKKSGTCPAQKKSRKFKRRPNNLLDEFMRRQRRISWLETHLWHAKRFHMVERWGFRLADRPCDKAFRACYRASAKHCLLQDVSYLSCIEISGIEDYIIGKLKNLCDCTTGLTMGAKCFLNGNREGECFVFKNESVKKPIGVVKFIWKKPRLKEDFRTIWIWVHPSFYSEFINVIISEFKVESIGSDEYFNRENNITVRELKYDLCRFSLRGPLSNSILYKALKIIDEQDKTDWVKKYLSSTNICKYREFWDSFKNLQSPAEISPRLIISLIVNDPRINLPKKRCKAIPEYNNYIDLTQYVPNLSPIWSKEVRKLVKESKKSDVEITKLRGENLVPGSDLFYSCPIPILLVQEPGCRDNFLGYGSGFDIIFPSGWAKPFWISLIMWGARAGGLRESESMAFEMGRPCILTPDTEAGRREEERITEEHEKRYFRLPPNKRVNYNKMGIVSPFRLNWNLLLRDWGGQGEYFVLKDKRVLNLIQDILEAKNKSFDLEINFNCLVPVKLSLIQKGKPDVFSIICLPLEEDLRVKSPPFEGVIEDVYQKKRKEMRLKHKVLLKRMRKSRIRAKEEGKVSRFS